MAKAKVRARKGRPPCDIYVVLWTTYDDEGVEAVYMTRAEAEAHCQREEPAYTWEIKPDYWVEKHTLSVDTLSSEAEGKD